MAALSPLPKMQFFDSNGEPLVGGKLYTYAAGTTTPLATYTSASGAVANSNPIILDSRGEASVWLAYSAYKFKLTNSADVEQWTVDNIAGDETFGASQWLTAVSGTNTLTATLSASNFAVYAVGQTFSFAAANANTGAVTLNINGLGAKSVTKTGTTALIANDILAGQVVTVVYDGTRFQVVNKSNLASPGPIGSTTASTGAFTALTATTLNTSGAVSCGGALDASGAATFYAGATVIGTIAAGEVQGASVYMYQQYGFFDGLGAGGSVTQLTSRTTAVTLNTYCGRIILVNATATAGVTTEFTVNSNKVVVSGTVTTIVTLNLADPGASSGAYQVYVSEVKNGYFKVKVECTSTPAAAEQPTLYFSLMRTALS